LESARLRGVEGSYGLRTKNGSQEIVFSRCFEDDQHQLQEKLQDGSSIFMTAKRLLAEEFVAFANESSFVSEIVACLRDPGNGLVTGLERV
jgi:hypothetical protein